jgi:hypothetical protein
LTGCTNSACNSRPALDPADRATYTALQEQIDAAGRDVWEPGRDEQAAAVCGLNVAEFHEMQDLKATHWQFRTREQRDRLAQLDPDDRPPLLEQQAALVCGLSIDEFLEKLRLKRIGRVRRPPHEQARLDELDASPPGATAVTSRGPPGCAAPTWSSRTRALDHPAWREWFGRP